MSASDETPDTRPWLIVLAASAGGIEAIRTILASLQPDLPAAVVVLVHRPADNQGMLDDILSRTTVWPVRTVGQGERVRPGFVYIVRPDSHLTVTPERMFLYRNGTSIRFVRSSANPLLTSAAEVYRDRMIAVVLSGGGHDATDGVQTVKAHGGCVIAQDRTTSQVWSMPREAIRTGAVDQVLPVESIADVLNAIVRGGGTAAPA